MQDLIQKICAATGISHQQALSTLEIVKNYAKEKAPMMAGAIDGLLGQTDHTAVVDPSAPAAPSTGILDKISDYIPGDAGQKVEDFAKNAANKAEDVFDNMKDKLGNMFGNDKK